MDALRDGRCPGCGADIRAALTVLEAASDLQGIDASLIPMLEAVKGRVARHRQNIDRVCANKIPREAELLPLVRDLILLQDLTCTRAAGLKDTVRVLARQAELGADVEDVLKETEAQFKQAETKAGEIGDLTQQALVAIGHARPAIIKRLAPKSRVSVIEVGSFGQLAQVLGKIVGGV